MAAAGAARQPRDVRLWALVSGLHWCRHTRLPSRVAVEIGRDSPAKHTADAAAAAPPARLGQKLRPSWHPPHPPHPPRLLPPSPWLAERHQPAASDQSTARRT